MAGVSILAQIQDAEVRNRLSQLVGSPKKALAPIGMALVKNTQERFRAGHGPGGAKWAPLHPMYAPIKRGPGILRASGMLMRSINYRVGTDDVRVGTNRIQARIDQFGGVIKPKRVQYLRFRMANGFWFKKKVTIPARPFLGIDSRDEQDIGDMLEVLLGGK